MYNNIESYVDSYLNYVHEHRIAVREAGKHIVGGIPFTRLAAHDNSKYSDIELYPYAMRFYGPIAERTSPKNSELFRTAWLNHCHKNDHHWQHWLIPGNVCTPVEMPEVCVREMIADWLSFGGPDEMADYLKQKLPGMMFHFRTKTLLASLLTDIFKNNDIRNFEQIILSLI